MAASNITNAIVNRSTPLLQEFFRNAYENTVQGIPQTSFTTNSNNPILLNINMKAGVIYKLDSEALFRKGNTACSYSVTLAATDLSKIAGFFQLSYAFTSGLGGFTMATIIPSNFSENTTSFTTSLTSSSSSAFFSSRLDAYVYSSIDQPFSYKLVFTPDPFSAGITLVKPYGRAQKIGRV